MHILELGRDILLAKWCPEFNGCPWCCEEEEAVVVVVVTDDGNDSST